jgi:hypothetical protein
MMALPVGAVGRWVGCPVGCPVGDSTGIIVGARVGDTEGYPVVGTISNQNLRISDILKKECV